MMTKSCQLWGTLLLSIIMLSFALGNKDCDPKKCNSESKNGGDHCSPLGNCSSGNYCCHMKCKGKECRQTCYTGVELCEMNLECEGNDCYQACNAKKCNLNCSGKKCKIQKCEGEGDVCEMDLECNNQECEQICKAKKCNLNCSGEKCKIQKCEGEGDVCEMHLECNNQNCEQICEAKVCNLTCSGKRCKTQSCTGEGQVCSKYFNANDCTQMCDGHSITFDSYTPNIVTSVGASTSRVYATKISTGHGMEAHTRLQSMSQSPLALISPLPSPSSHPPSAAVLPARTSVYSSLLLSSSETSAAGSSSSPSLRTPLSSTSEVIKNLANDSVSKLKGGVISRILSLMEAIGIFEDFITSTQNQKKPFTKEEIEIIRNSVFKVAVALEVFALDYGKHRMIGANSSVEINSRKLVLAIQKTYRKNASDFYLGKRKLQTSLEVSYKNFANNESVVVGIVYKDLHEVLITDQPFRTITGAARYLDSWITAVALDPKPKKLKENVILRFRNLKTREGGKKCMFWSGSSESLGEFSETGCHLVTSRSNSEETVCSCNHSTHFAVLLDSNSSPGLTEEDETILEIITNVGLSLSIFAILLTIILYAYLTDVWQPLTQIRLSLSVSLGAGQIIFLAGINATENMALCVLTAAFLQYFLMAAFCWMLVEGIYFFLFVVKVYNINTKMHMYHFISWGLPLIMVSISISIAAGKDGIKSYTSEKYCWLSSTNNLIWIFVTFVAFIEVLNTLILVRVIKEMSTLMQPTGENNRTQQIREVFKFNIYYTIVINFLKFRGQRLGIKTCAVMIPVLGVTWLFGLLLSLHKAFAYIFTIFNSTQGILIFVLHCVRNSQIRERLKRKMNIIFPSAADHGNSAKKNSQVNPIDAGEVCAVKLQSFKE